MEAHKGQAIMDKSRWLFSGMDRISEVPAGWIGKRQATQTFGGALAGCSFAHSAENGSKKGHARVSWPPDDTTKRRFVVEGEWFSIAKCLSLLMWHAVHGLSLVDGESKAQVEFFSAVQKQRILCPLLRLSRAR